MKIFQAVALSSVLLAATNVWAEEEPVKSQEYYDQELTGNLQEMTAQLQAFSDEFVKYMNAMNKALNATMPQLSQDMGKALASIKPVAETMQKNAENFAQEVNAQLGEFSEPTEKENLTIGGVRPELASETITNPENVIIPEPALTDEVSSAIDAELSQFKQQPRKIKLFPSSVE